MYKENDQTIGLPSQAERRVCPRYRPSSVVYVKVGKENGGIVLNISEGGMQLAAGEVLGWDAALPLSLKLSYNAAPIQADGQLVWLSESKRTAGFEFVSLNQQVRAQLRDWISLEENATVENLHAPEAADPPDLEPSPELLALEREPVAIVKWASQPDPKILPAAERSLGWLRIAMISILCFVAGMVAGVAWVAQPVGSRAVRPASPSTAVSQSVTRDDRQRTEPSNALSTAP